MTAFEKWLGRAKLFYHIMQIGPCTPSIVSYKNDLRIAYQAGERNERRKEWIKINGRMVRRKHVNRDL